jgi:hypothetical protein
MGILLVFAQTCLPPLLLLRPPLTFLCLQHQAEFHLLLLDLLLDLLLFLFIQYRRQDVFNSAISFSKSTSREVMPAFFRTEFARRTSSGVSKYSVRSMGLPLPGRLSNSPRSIASLDNGFDDSIE